MLFSAYMNERQTESMDTPGVEAALSDLNILEAVEDGSSRHRRTAVGNAAAAFYVSPHGIPGVRLSCFHYNGIGVLRPRQGGSSGSRVTRIVLARRKAREYCP